MGEQGEAWKSQRGTGVFLPLTSQAAFAASSLSNWIPIFLPLFPLILKVLVPILQHMTGLLHEGIFHVQGLLEPAIYERLPWA